MSESNTPNDGVVQVVNAQGEAAGSLTNAYLFEAHDDLASKPLKIISIVGVQSSGKSTLLNRIFGTHFSVASRSSMIGSATTKGIYAALDSADSHIVALDVEGSDSRERGRDGRIFHARLTSFVTAISDAIIVNLWYHDIGRFDGAGYSLIADVFQEALKISKSSPPFHARLVFTLRDVDVELLENYESLQSLLFADVEDIFAKVVSSAESESTLNDLFSLSCIALPHMKHHGEQFSDIVGKLASSLKSDELLKEEDSKGIAADAGGSFLRSLWETQYSLKTDDSLAAVPAATGETAASAESRGLPGEDGATAPSTGSSLLAAYKCNEAFSEVLAEATAAMKSLCVNTLDAGEKIEGLGLKAEEIMTKAMNDYDEKTEAYKEEMIQLRKRRELESIIDTQQQGMFMKQVHLLRENALTHFKSATNSDEIPSDLAFYTADSQFLKESEEAKRPGCSWNVNQQRNDLQNMMQEISTQRKRLLTSQVTAAQHQAHALQYLQMQQSQMNAIQAQAYGGGGAGQWNIGAAYRPPDTNINASLSYQQGRTNIQISMVPDESASLLGPNGFTSGVGPGNLGLSFNIGL